MRCSILGAPRLWQRVTLSSGRPARLPSVITDPADRADLTDTAASAGVPAPAEAAPAEAALDRPAAGGQHEQVA